jgi:hypothetical protein
MQGIGCLGDLAIDGKIILKRIGYIGVDWIHVAQNTFQEGISKSR